MNKYVISFCFMGTLVACHSLEAPTNPALGLLQSDAEHLGLADLATQFTTLSCSRMWECCTPVQIEGRLGAPAKDEATCRQQLGKRYGTYVERLAQSQSAGRLAYHSDRAKRCLAVLQAQSCFDYAKQGFLGPQPGSDCDTWIEAETQVGSACNDDNECVTDFCQGRGLDAAGALHAGTCGSLPTLGQGCDTRCAKGAYCDTSLDVPVCVAAAVDTSRCSDDDQCLSGICEAPAGVGGGSGVCQKAPTSCVGR